MQKNIAKINNIFFIISLLLIISFLVLKDNILNGEDDKSFFGNNVASEYALSPNIMSSLEAAKLILQSGGIGKGGEIFSLDMGSPIKIIDIANELIRLSGLEPEIDIPISFIGARAGEEIGGDLIFDKESFSKTIHEKIMQIHPKISENKVNEITSRIMEGELVGHEFDNNLLRSILSSLVPEYQPLKKDQAEPLILKVAPKAQA